MVDPVHNIKKRFVNFNKWDEGLFASRSPHCSPVLRCKVAVHGFWKIEDFPECNTWGIEPKGSLGPDRWRLVLNPPKGVTQKLER
jgi:hypothetical protein